MSQKSQWKSSTGFILASAGSAIGLGALWKFPYMAGMYGGGAFLFMFVLFTILIGLPFLIMEFAVGKLGRTYTTQLFGKLTGQKWLNSIGWIGNLTVFLLFGFYSVIGGWIVVYIGIVGLQWIHLGLAHLSDIRFESVISQPAYTLIGQLIFIGLTCLIVMLGVEKGLEKASKVMMPLLFIFLIIIVAQSLSLKGAMEGVRFLFEPRVTDITMDSILFALGQSFFALSLGTTGMMTYASYAPKEMPIKRSAITIVAMNIVIAILAGLAIFPALQAFGYQPKEGPGLLFKVLPLVFEKIQFGALFYIIFLVLFLFAALTSSISLLELNISNLTRNDNRKRTKMTMLVGAGVVMISIPAMLSFSSLSGLTFGAGTLFDNMDFLVSNILLPIGALASTLAIGHKVKKETLREAFGNHRLKLFYPWYILVKWVLPCIILAVFILQFV
ncbi:sodium-dependent transporter [Staphylococcus schleiferi]|uniref:sodium-dependent transporter n=1 Tax=Staphylococcus schleiferi TaxID=1295 RepID=UPI001431C0D5|nr:sodium-dependent transporter [Staphylococcus schleiferi]QPA24192.1 sodium-dependent transporter [Mammaliicoccus fleurettii]MBF1993242.1 sodium-dependent transporter [Staphylococcus schleiferi]MBF2038721.1 sodium-dependent transporter [Staphylococcus schleiferi]MBF2100710.1 sodium-dependent transporter [Staphylococcus schleiferi]MBF2103004.1 sodium-dependent transporter [Staphylococcus schleiferi]